MKTTFKFLAFLCFVLSLVAMSCGTATTKQAATEVDKQVRDSLLSLRELIDCQLINQNCPEIQDDTSAKPKVETDKQVRVRDTAAMIAFKEIKAQVINLIKENKSLKNQLNSFQEKKKVQTKNRK